MLEWLKAKYANMKRRRAMKQEFCAICDELCNYLSGFVFEGKMWATERVLDSSKEYLHLINVKCGNANFIKSKIEQDKTQFLQAFSRDDKSTMLSVFKSIYDITLNIMGLLNTCVNVVPYSKMDDFYSYTYRVKKRLLLLYEYQLS